MKTNHVKRTPSKSLYQGKVYVVITPECGSSCLTFVGQITAMPRVTLVGIPTSEDSIYTEFYKDVLPNGLLRIGMPLKATIHRHRGKVPYLPKYTYKGDIFNTAKLKNWLASIIRA